MVNDIRKNDLFAHESSNGFLFDSDNSFSSPNIPIYENLRLQTNFNINLHIYLYIAAARIYLKYSMSCEQVRTPLENLITH
jgi:hypothetical protein